MYYKKIAKKVLLLALVVSLFGCDDFLVEEPLNQISTEFFYQNDNDALAALTGAYAQLKSNNGYYRQQFLSNMYAGSDQGPSSWQHGDFRRGTVVNTNPMLIRTWIEIYAAIKDANNVIFNVPEIEDIDEELKLRIVGEAKFLRALHYFNLVRCFGEVPLRTVPMLPKEEGLPVSPTEDIYAVIIDDLLYASAHTWGFNETRNGYTNNIGRVTKASAHALLSKVYLQIASSKRTAGEGVLGNANYLGMPLSVGEYYQLAKDHADFAIQEPGYNLVSTLEEWVNLFDANNGNNAEMLFEIQGSSLAEQGTAVSNLFSPQLAGLSGGGWGGVNRIINNFTNLNIDKFDPRFQNSIIHEYQDQTRSYVLNDQSNGYIRTFLSDGSPNGTLNFVFTSKYIDRVATTEYTSQQNWHVIRLADVYLMRAEALAEINQNPSLAEQDINTLRQRVGMENFSSAGMSMEDFRNFILRERGVELLAEGQRFFDITRMGKYDELCRNAYGNTDGQRDETTYRWPIPLIEVAANPNID